MEGSREDDLVVVGGDARQRFYDARGYGRPRGDNEIALAPVEAAHLLSRGDLDAVDGLSFQEYLVETDAVLEFVVYKNLRDRGFYASPAREGWVEDPGGVDFVVHPRGTGPQEGEVAYRVRVIGERESVPAADLGDVVLAVVDEDGELTYFETREVGLDGTCEYEPPSGIEGTLHEDRVLVWDPPEALYERGFYGQRLYGRNAETGPLQLSLLEAAYLARTGSLALDPEAVLERGRGLEGERFDRRLDAYTAIRDAGSVPKSGFKFGADFRTYDRFETVSDLSHSDRLVRVLPREHSFVPRDLSLDVRLAGGVRKRMVFALTDANGDIDWLSADRLTP
ncbi:MAG: tRNA-intron lyase [Haloferacaceae archaeon]